MRAIRLALAAAGLAAASHAASVAATAFSIDQSDLWWLPTESGWGIQFVQRGALIFATMFIYAANGTPTWYVALLKPPGVASENTAKATTTLSWSGDLEATTGTGFASTWNPMAFNVTKVGTMTWTPTDATSGTLVYSVNGATVSKSIVREFITLDDFSGTYVGGIQLTQSGCIDTSKNGSFTDFANITITQSGPSFELMLSTATTGTSCTFQGPLTQAGRFAAATGTFVCNGKTTTGTVFNMVVGPEAISARFKSSDSASGCNSTGGIAGERM